MNKTPDPLMTYKQKRDFSVTPEPSDDVTKKTQRLSFVVQKHAARSKHYDLRLEFDGSLKSWAIPKGPSLDPTQKRLAVHVEDHPLSYAEFEGVIPPPQYGAGTVIVWDRGTWEPMVEPRSGFSDGHLKFRLYGEKLGGAWALVRMRNRAGEKQESWLLIKERDDHARAETEFDVVASLPDSVLKGVGSATILSGAQLAVIPDTLAPQLATLVDRAPADGDWVYEIKFDGYRILARIDNGEVALYTRNGHNWTAKLGSLATELKELKITSGWLDGEVVMLGADGMPDFGALQNAFETASTNELHYYVFDIPYYEGFDLRDVDLGERRALLAKIISGATTRQVSFSEDFVASGSDILSSACRLGLEGIIGKRKSSPYTAGRSLNWIKLKCIQRQEFVVVGYTESKAASRGVGALLLGVYDDAHHLRYAGRVGSGFNSKTANLLKEKLTRLEADKTALFEPPSDIQGNWVVPELVVEVSFAEWTKDGRLRHPVYHGLRSDKPPTSVTIEKMHDTMSSKADYDRTSNAVGKSAAPEFITSPISNPERVIDPSSGLRKFDLVNYYHLASELMLPHLTDRPVSFLRAPSGINGHLFFQKHGAALKIPGLKQLDAKLDPEHPALLEIDSLVALIGAVQMNVVEFHTWNATTKNIDKPDRMVFDLDPGESVAWPLLLEAADLTRILLKELGLQSFVKTSGGKGLHIVVPLSPRDDWEKVKDFSKAVAEHLARVIPSHFTAVSGPRNRIGKVFIDYNRNGRGATTVAAFSARARPGMGVSMPCSWHELTSLTGGAHWTIANAAQRLQSGENPWADYSQTKQILSAASKKKILI
ncbi:MAG: DNA ligase D [Firmicutes bacterium]|nr:DNA ligase D [Bacillota bacterium]